MKGGAGQLGRRLSKVWQFKARPRARYPKSNPLISASPYISNGCSHTPLWPLNVGRQRIHGLETILTDLPSPGLGAGKILQDRYLLSSIEDI